VMKDLGWEATASNVATIYYNFRTAYDAGEIVVYCPALLSEMRVFTKRDLEGSIKKQENPELQGVTTRHFDLLRAACIAWEMKTHSRPALIKRPPAAPPEKVSDYKG
jgi:hypothetical protein